MKTESWLGPALQWATPSWGHGATWCRCNNTTHVVVWGGVRMSSPTAEEPARGALLAYIAGLVVLRFNVQMVF